MVLRGSVRDALVTVVAQLLAAAVAFGTSIVVARLLGPAGLGTAQLVQTLGNQLALLLSLGVTISIVRTVALEPDDSGAFSAGLLLLCLLVPIFGCLWPLAAGLSRSLIDDPGSAETVVRWGVPLAWTFLSQDIATAALRGRRAYGAIAVGTVGARLAGLVAIGLAFAAGQRSVVTVAVCLVIGNAVVGCLLILVCVRMFGVVWTGVLSSLRRLVRFNLGGHVGTIVQEVSYRLDLFLVAGLLSTSAAGVYGVAGLLCTLLWYVPNAVGTVLLSRLPRAGAATQERALLSACRASLAVMMTVAAGAALSASAFIPLVFGSRFQGAVVPFLILLPGAILMSVWKVVANAMAAIGHPAMKVPSAIAGAAVGLGLDVWLIPAHGIEGAAIAASIAYALTSFVLLRAASRQTGIAATAFLVPDFRAASLRQRAP